MLLNFNLQSADMYRCTFTELHVTQLNAPHYICSSTNPTEEQFKLINKLIYVSFTNFRNQQAILFQLRKIQQAPCLLK